jgi:hypothetical protein
MVSETNGQIIWTTKVTSNWNVSVAVVFYVRERGLMHVRQHHLHGFAPSIPFLRPEDFSSLELSASVASLLYAMGFEPIKQI